jgi:hypothetical protein
MSDVVAGERIHVLLRYRIPPVRQESRHLRLVRCSSHSLPQLQLESFP